MHQISLFPERGTAGSVFISVLQCSYVLSSYGVGVPFADHCDVCGEESDKLKRHVYNNSTTSPQPKPREPGNHDDQCRALYKLFQGLYVSESSIKATSATSAHVNH